MTYWNLRRFTYPWVLSDIHQILLEQWQLIYLNAEGFLKGFQKTGYRPGKNISD